MKSRGFIIIFSCVKFESKNCGRIYSIRRLLCSYILGFYIVSCSQMLDTKFWLRKFECLRYIQCNNIWAALREVILSLLKHFFFNYCKTIDFHTIHFYLAKKLGTWKFNRIPHADRNIMQNMGGLLQLFECSFPTEIFFVCVLKCQVCLSLCGLLTWPEGNWVTTTRS